MDDKILLDIQKQLGRIEATSSAIKEDIADLKAKDVEADQKLEQAYNKAMDYARTRQDQIKENLQHQIDNNKSLIVSMNESFANLNKNIDTLFKEFTERVNEKLATLNSRVSELETKKQKTIVKWWDRIVDKLGWIAVIAALAVLLKWLNAPPEIMSQLPH